MRGWQIVLFLVLVWTCRDANARVGDESGRVAALSGLGVTDIDLKSNIVGSHYHIYSPFSKIQLNHGRHGRSNDRSNRGMISFKPLLASPEGWIQSLTDFHYHLDHVTVSDEKLTPPIHRARRAYLDMLQSFVLGNIYGRAEKSMKLDGSLKYTEYNATKRIVGEDMTYLGTTMIGIRRLQALEDLIVTILDRQIPGDIVETGVWRGGASIYALAVLRAYLYTPPTLSREQSVSSHLSVATNHRRVYLCDSFAGLPPGNKNLHKDDVGWSGLTYLSVSDEEVVRHIQEFNTMDSRVVIVKGFFNESIPALQQKVLIPQQRAIAILRLDGDMYESTMDVLYHLYSAVSVGGFVIVDDWDGFPAKDACLDFFQVHQIQPEIVPVDRWSVYFQKTKQIDVQYWRYEKKQFK
jgi:hypothetical protein